MPQYRLTTPHYDGTSVLDAGTIVGDDTANPWRDANGDMLPPSLGMEGVDEESQKIIDEHYDENVRQDAIDPGNGRDMSEATSDMTMNKPNPNLSPGPRDASAGGPQLTTPAPNRANPSPLLAGGPSGPKPSTAPQPNDK